MATFAEQMVTKLEAILLENAGVQSVSIDGQSVSYADLKAEHEYWRQRVLKESGKRPVISMIRLDGFATRR